MNPSYNSPLFSIVVALFFSMVSCKQQVDKNRVVFSGQISGKISDSLVLIGANAIDKTEQKVILIDKNGEFSETFSTSPAHYDIMYGDGVSFGVFLKNGYELHLAFDTEKQLETIKFTGIGATENEYLVKASNEFWESDVHEANESLSDADYDKKVHTFFDAKRAQLAASKFKDSAFIAFRGRSINEMEQYLLNERQNDPKKLIGKTTPEFLNYKNIDGSTSSLSDYKGNYIYIDLWATWCGPCVKEIPFLASLEKKYHEQPITFISISVDDQSDEEKWKSMIKDKKMEGIQLLADNALNSSFCKSYHINGIPRFIFIDPKGKIISADAPRPSDENLIALFKKNGL